MLPKIPWALLLASAVSAALGAGCGSGEASAEGAARTRGSAEPLPATTKGEPLSVPSFTLPRSDPARIPEKLALLVGIDRYAPGSGLGELAGAVNDVRAVRAMLEGRFDFLPEDILVLENEQAGHEALVRAFHGWLIERAGPDTEVLFWFSGHGSTVPDEGDEVDGRDETMLAWDSRAEGRRGSFDLVDDEFQALLAALSEKTERVTVVTDSCHSGSVVRGDSPGTPRVRFASPGTEPFDPANVRVFWPEELSLDGDVSVDPERYVHIAACAPDQQANELDLAEEEEDQPHGALSFFLMQTLQSARPDMSYSQLANEASVQVSAQFPGQTVWYEGAHDRTLFSGRFKTQVRGLPARMRSNGRTVEVSAGPLTGLRSGSQLTLLDALSGEELATATVQKVYVTKALARLDGEAALDPETVGALRAREDSRPAGLDPLPVHVTDEGLAELLGAESADALCELAPEPGAGRYHVLQEEGRWVFLTPEGLHIWIEDDASVEAPAEERQRKVAEALVARMRDELDHKALMTMSQVPGDLKLKARFVLPNAEDVAKYPGDLQKRVDPGLLEVAANREYSCTGISAKNRDEKHVVVLEIENPSSEQVHLAVFSVAEDRSQHLIWPGSSAGRDQSVLTAGETKRVPLIALLEPGWEKDRPMRDRYLIVATSDYVDFSGFRSRGSVYRGHASENENWAPVFDLVMAGRTRGSRDGIDLDPKRIGVTVIDLLVRRPDPE